MEINYFTFRPDDHYGYAEIDRISKSFISPIEEEDAIEIWVNADYSWDHDEDEGGDGEGYYNEYGYRDLYGNTYLIGNDDGQADAIINTGLNNFDGTENEMSDIMMHDLSLINGVEFVICLPSWSGEEISFYIKGEKSEGNKSLHVDGNLIEIMSNIIQDTINKGDLEKAADNFLIMSKFNGLEDMLKSKISDEDYLKLEKMSRLRGIAGRFGH
jgi:hypothetical protein